MTTVTIKGKEYDLKYTFNSFKYMQDLDVSVFEEIEKKPFLIAPVVETLLFGAVNHNAKQKVKQDDLIDFLDEFISDENNSLVELLESLMELLQKSGFFKSLQKK